VTRDRIAAVLLAAGESTRMRRLKQLLPWGGTTLLAWQVAQLRAAGAEDVVVVLGHAAEEIRPAVPPDTRVVLNEAYKTGRASSLRRGAEAVDDAAGAVLVLSVDQPRPAWLSRRLIERWRERHALIVSPRFAAGFGHPILVDGSLLPELRQVADATLGLRGLIDSHLDRADSVSVSNSRIDIDLNSIADYEAALRDFEEGAWESDQT
jgi:molybdenum cofactor cytidylyltransferase